MDRQKFAEPEDLNEATVSSLTTYWLPAHFPAAFHELHFSPMKRQMWRGRCDSFEGQFHINS